jgi:hypothetical protein
MRGGRDRRLAVPHHPVNLGVTTTAAGATGSKLVLVGDPAQISAVEAGGMFCALVRDRDGRAPELSDVRRFTHDWEKKASVELRGGSPEVIDTYGAHGRITDGSREEMLDALYSSAPTGRSRMMTCSARW